MNINDVKNFELLDIRGEKLSIGDEIAFSVTKGRGGARLVCGFISMIKKCEKTVRVTIKSRRYREDIKSFYYKSGECVDSIIKLERGFVFNLGNPEFAKLFAKKIEWINKNPDLVEKASESDDLGFSEFELK
jgi:hypothetical protein